MKIRTQLIISMVFFSIALLIISASMITTNQQIERLNIQEELAKNIELKANELSYLSNDFLLYHESQQIERWKSQYSYISDDMSNLTVDRPDQQALVNSIKTDQQRLKTVFTDILSQIESSSSAFDPAFIQVSWSRIGIQTQGIISDASRLSQKIHNEQEQVKLINYLLSISLLGIFGVFLLTNYFLIYRRTLKSISNLQEGTNIIGSGNLDFSIEEKKNDEFGELSHAFNRMTTNLKTVTASKADLEREITDRKCAEEALRKAHDELELRVQERTAQLREANIELETKINERKLAEEKIREQASLLDNAQEAIGVRSLENHLIYWNKGAQRLYGWTAQEAIGRDPIEFLFKDKEEPPVLIEAKRIVLEKGEWTGELHQLTKDGKEVIVESHWTLIYDSEGKPKSILVVNTDITEKKMFESHLLRAQRMESIGILAGGIAHNLNNMLTPMMLSLQILKGKFTDQQSQRLLAILEKNSQRSADLIKQVLSFSRGVEGERTPLEAKHLITEIEKVAKETFPRNIEIKTDIPENLFTISGDVTQLHQVIMNLCVNARDAMPDSGILSITATNFFIDENYARMHTEAKVGSYVAITVSDIGTGIPPKILDRIFEPFFTTKEVGKGTGLGLSTALAIVKSHGGFINVYSEVGKGTKFSIYLPAIKTRTELQNVEEQKLELFTGHGESVLIAEDEDSIREVTVSTLEKYGYKVLAANNGADAVVLYAQNKDKVKVILMDMMMPIMDGQASIRAIRKINPEVKVIAVSGLAEKDKLAEIASSHTKAFLPKPYTAEKMLKTIHEVMSEGDKK
ncbi:MAG: ATP-binding protein [Candidatus Methanoperedens sp.]